MSLTGVHARGSFHREFPVMIPSHIKVQNTLLVGRWLLFFDKQGQRQGDSLWENSFRLFYATFQNLSLS